MKLLITAAAALILAGCAAKPFEPVVDLKVSEKPGEMQEDLMSCEWLIKRYGPDHWFRAAPDENMVRKCLKGRGHNVLN